MTLDDLLRRFAVLRVDDGQTSTIRGTLLAVAQNWLVVLPPGPETDEAIDCLAHATDLACKVLTSE